MDHFNAMFEDKRTGLWRQATGEAIIGPLKGHSLSELAGRQMTLGEWATEHPNTRVLQADPSFTAEFEGMKNYERGLSKGQLTRRDSASWRSKLWSSVLSEQVSQKKKKKEHQKAGVSIPAF